MAKPLFTQVLQICVVVDDLDAYVKRYNDEYGIGPWIILNFDRNTVKDMTVRGQRVDYSMKLALCNALNIQWEIIQPTDENSIYAEFLRTHGPGLHHVALAVEDYDQVMKEMAARGNYEVQGGTDLGGQHFTYLDLTRDLGLIVEIYKTPKDFVLPPPERTYP
ncbi:MAG: VOC family protein [Moorellales bacterium]